MKAHFVRFYSPGTLFAEQTMQEIPSWDVNLAREMMKSIVERHGANPYSFQFITKSRADDELDSRETARSPMYYVGGKIETLEEIVARNDPKEEILISNMKNNGYARVWRTTSGWQWTQPLHDDDVVLAA